MKTKAEQCKVEGNKCLKEGNYTAAVIHYTEAVKHEPNSAVLHSNRALAFLKIDQLFLAMEDAQKVIKFEPSWPKGFFRKAEIEFRAGEYEKALISYKQAFMLDPGDQGLVAAINKTNKEINKDRRDATQKPLMYSCIGLLVGVIIVAADQFLTAQPAIQYSILQVMLVAACGGVGYAAAKIQRLLMLSQRKALLEEPLDLLKAFWNQVCHASFPTHSVTVRLQRNHYLEVE
uniref:Uncharacterized protein n=1 Tax=Arion vulgaris TaxID=1028688 RepID=A0A0B7AXL2_9EUPU